MRKGGHYVEVTGFEVNCERAKDREKSSHSTASTGTRRTDCEHGKWRGSATFGVP